MKMMHVEGRDVTTKTSLRHQLVLFGNFALMAVLSCSGRDLSVVVKRATELAQRIRTFGKL